MEEIIRNLKTPEQCIQFIDKYSELIKQAYLRVVELRASPHAINNEIENELLKAIYAYEEVLSKKNHRRTYASRTWQMVHRRGIIEAAERAVYRKIETQGYMYLAEMGLQVLTFEAVIVKYPYAFNPKVVEHAKARLEAYKKL